jgi:hypothetical protein
MGTRACAAVIAAIGYLLVASPAFGQGQSPASSASKKEEATNAAAAREGARGAKDVVKVGALINDVQQLDLQSHSYNVDMYMWFKWRNPDIDPSRSFEFLNAFELWGHILTYETPKPEVLPDGTHYQVLRNQGKFNTKLPLERYPFDTQHLRVLIEDSHADERELVYVPDDDPVALSADLTIPGWDIGDPSLTVVSNRYDSSFGDPRVGDLSYSRAIVDLPVTRPKGTYALKLLLPMLLVALTALLSLSVHPRYVEARVGIGITALLTLVALQLTSNSSLPEVNYLLLLDKLYILSYAFVVVTLAMIVRHSWIDMEGDIAIARRIDRRSMAVLTGVYFAIAAAIFVESLA